MDLAPGVVFGRYTISAEIGRGGMGRVMLAVDGVLKRKVALKILLPGLMTEKEIVARFFREARLSAQLTHPNTVHIYDLGEALGMPFIAMEYVDGKPLTAYLGDAFVPAEQRLRWLVDVAKGLSAAHARGLLHRDMKPANVIVSNEGSAKVVDFGLAKLVDFGLAKLEAAPPPSRGPTTEARATFQTAAGFLVGTPAYMAPEQFEAAPVDARADQFGWALTAYALMLGKNLRKDDPLLFGPIPLLSDKVAISRRTAEIILRALSNDREMRFPSMEALLAELEPAVLNMNADLARSLVPVPSSLPAASARPPEDATPRMAGRPPARARRPKTPPLAPPLNFCPDCGLPVGMSSPKCSGPHAPAFPRPPGATDDETSE